MTDALLALEMIRSAAARRWDRHGRSRSQMRKTSTDLAVGAVEPVASSILLERVLWNQAYMDWILTLLQLRYRRLLPTAELVASHRAAEHAFCCASQLDGPAAFQATSLERPALNSTQRAAE